MNQWRRHSCRRGEETRTHTHTHALRNSLFFTKEFLKYFIHLFDVVLVVLAATFTKPLSLRDERQVCG